MKKKKIFFPAVIVAVITVFLAVIIIVLRMQINELNKKYDELQYRLEQQQDIVDELNYEFTLSEKDYIEKYAREKLGFHKSGEIVFKDSN
jgi:cell division protein FtsL